MATTLTVNGAEHVLDLDPETPLLYVLRNHLGLKAARFGCGLGLCGACNVVVDGTAVKSCDTPLWAVAGRVVTTLEGLGGPDDPHPLQTAFIEKQAGQCGFCLSGVMMSAAALLEGCPEPDADRVCAALDGNLCRCGAHQRMVEAVLDAAKRVHDE